MEFSPQLGLSYLHPQQSQKHVTVNESFRRLDALVQMTASSRTRVDEPQTPSAGDAYILPENATGASWSAYGQNTVMVFQDGAWANLTPKVGWRIFVEDEDQLFVFKADSWQALTGAGQEQSSQLGINTQADMINRLAVKSDAVLFSHDDVTPGSGDIRYVINKAATPNSAALIFQTGFEGRVEVGLTGNDDFSLKVSPDGINFLTALTVNHQSADTTIHKLTIGDGGALARLSFDTDNGVPYWALGQADDRSFFLQKLNGGFGTGGRVIIFDDAGNLGLWGVPSSKGKIATRSNVNTDNVDNILYLEQTALSPVSGIAQFHNNVDNATPILRCTTNTKTVLNVPANGSIEVEAPMKLHSVTIAQLPSAGSAGAGALIYISDDGPNGAIGFSDGTSWRRLMTGDAIV